MPSKSAGFEKRTLERTKYGTSLGGVALVVDHHFRLFGSYALAPTPHLPRHRRSIGWQLSFFSFAPPNERDLETSVHGYGRIRILLSRQLVS